MKIPFVTRSHHEEVVALLKAERDLAMEERRILLDRFAQVGLGGPLFAAREMVEAAEAEAEKEAEAPYVAPEQKLIATRRPNAIRRGVEIMKERSFRRKYGQPSNRAVAALDSIKTQVASQ